jgi:hypothetical protein
MERTLRRTCKHCRAVYDYYPEFEPDEAFLFCSPECMECHYSREEPDWPAPCSMHREQAEKRREGFVKAQEGE